MNWFIYALATTLSWGAADLFYKLGANERDRYSHLKTSVCVGFVMGAHALVTLLTGNIGYDPVNLIRYLPVSSMYILSMTVGYFGLRYLELSVSSPIQNTSGAIVCILCLVFLKKSLDPLSAVAVTVICVGIVILGILEKRITEKGRKVDSANDEKYRKSFVAFFMPIIYCVVDALGTFFDAWYLDDFAKTPLVGVTEDTLEDVANTSYELTFFLCAVVLLIYIRLIKKDRTPLLGKRDGERLPVNLYRLIAAVLETAGQFTYVYAMSGKAEVVAPMIASYSIVSVILSRLFLKEKLTVPQYAAIGAVMAGIAVLG